MTDTVKLSVTVQKPDTGRAMVYAAYVVVCNDCQAKQQGLVGPGGVIVTVGKLGWTWASSSGGIGRGSNGYVWRCPTCSAPKNAV